jgi:hypothetical protein
MKTAQDASLFQKMLPILPLRFFRSAAFEHHMRLTLVVAAPGFYDQDIKIIIRCSPPHLDRS